MRNNFYGVVIEGDKPRIVSDGDTILNARYKAGKQSGLVHVLSHSTLNIMAPGVLAQHIRQRNVASYLAQQHREDEEQYRILEQRIKARKTLLQQLRDRYPLTRGGHSPSPETGRESEE